MRIHFADSSRCKNVCICSAHAHKTTSREVELRYLPCLEATRPPGYHGNSSEASPFLFNHNVAACDFRHKSVTPSPVLRLSKRVARCVRQHDWHAMEFIFLSFSLRASFCPCQAGFRRLQSSALMHSCLEGVLRGPSEDSPRSPCLCKA